MRLCLAILVLLFSSRPAGLFAAESCTEQRSVSPEHGILRILSVPGSAFLVDGKRFVLPEAAYTLELTCPAGAHRIECVAISPKTIKVPPERTQSFSCWSPATTRAQLRAALLSALEEGRTELVQQRLAAVPDLRDDPHVRWYLADQALKEQRHAAAATDFDYYLRYAPAAERRLDQTNKATQTLEALRGRLGRLLVYGDYGEKFDINEKLYDAGQTIWLTPGRYLVEWSDKTLRVVTIQPGKLCFLYRQESTQILPKWWIAQAGEMTFGQRISLWLARRATEALQDGYDLTFADELLWEARSLWSESYVVKAVTNESDRIQGRTKILAVLAAPGERVSVDGASYQGTGYVEEIRLRPETNDAQGTHRKVRFRLAKAPLANLMLRGFIHQEVGLSVGGRSFFFVPGVRCFDLSSIEQGATSPRYIYRRQDCPYYQSGGAGFRVAFTLYPLAWTTSRFLAHIGVGAQVESLYMSDRSGRSLQAEVWFRSTTTLPLRQRNRSAEIQLSYLRRSFSNDLQEAQFPFDVQGRPVSTAGTTGLPGVIHHSLALTYRHFVPTSSPAVWGTLLLGIEARMMLPLFSEGDMAQGSNGVLSSTGNTITGGYGLHTDFIGAAVRFTPLLWVHRTGITALLDSYIEGNFFTHKGTVSEAAPMDQFSPDGQSLERASPTRYVAYAPVSALTAVELYYGATLMLGYQF